MISQLSYYQPFKPKNLNRIPQNLLEKNVGMLCLNKQVKALTAVIKPG